MSIPVVLKNVVTWALLICLRGVLKMLYIFNIHLQLVAAISSSLSRRLHYVKCIPTYCYYGRACGILLTAIPSRRCEKSKMINSQDISVWRTTKFTALRHVRSEKSSSYKCTKKVNNSVRREEDVHCFLLDPSNDKSLG